MSEPVFLSNQTRQNKRCAGNKCIPRRKLPGRRTISPYTVKPSWWYTKTIFNRKTIFCSIRAREQWSVLIWHHNDAQVHLVREAHSGSALRCLSSTQSWNPFEMLSAPSRHWLKGSHYYHSNMKTPFALRSRGKKGEKKMEIEREERRKKNTACQAETRLRHIAWDLIGHRLAVKK